MPSIVRHWSGVTFTCHKGRRDEPFTIHDAARWVERPWVDVVLDEFGAPMENMPEYGQQFCRAAGMASLLLCLDYKPEEKEKLLAAIPAIQPIRNEELSRMASGYGWRSDPFTKARKMHWGMDFTAPKGIPVYATGDGKVTRADNNSSGYGKHIRVEHGYGYMSLYGHLSKYNVRVGQKIERGDLVGFVGSTGRSEAPHLHYEVWKEGERINPINFYYGSLTAEEFEEMLKYASQENQSLD